MCVDPVTASAMMAAGAKIVQGVADYSSNMSNAKIAKTEGRLAMDAATDESNRINQEGQRYLGSQRVAQAASGVDLSQGSPAEAGAESARNIELDRLNALYSGALQKYAKDRQATQYKRNAIAGVAGALFGSGASILGGGDPSNWFASAAPGKGGLTSSNAGKGGSYG